MAKTLALGADAVSKGTAALVALGDKIPGNWENEYRETWNTAGAFDDWQKVRTLPENFNTRAPNFPKDLIQF
ncbi:MAG: hypothetical protein CM1200mP30_03580 [Pseudomonadota bacterium]|nr:MAG: hypothetical protein CM1200mP30_03580 [Pseudomonadota bacterium]